MRSKEELDVLINEQVSIRDGVQEKLRLLDAELDELVEGPRRGAYVGRFFRHENSYGIEEKWFVYYRVISAATGGFWDVRTVSFEKTAHDEVSIDLDRGVHIPSLNDEITEAEYMAEWSKLACEADLAVRGMRR